MTRRRLAALAVALALALPFLVAGEVRAETPPAPNLTSTTRDLGTGYGQTVWWDAAGNAYDLGLVFRLPGPRAVPGIAKSVVDEGGTKGLVDEAARHYGASEATRLRAHRIIECESHYENVANRRGSGASGPAQFLPSTFNANKAAAGFPGADVGNVRANVYTALYLMTRGQWSHWRACW